MSDDVAEGRPSRPAVPAPETLRFNEAGLIPCIAQDAVTGDVLMMAWMNAASLARTAETGLLCFWSRSREALWQKGESSGNVLRLVRMHADCDADTLLALVHPAGPACHRGTPTCFDAETGEVGLAEGPRTVGSALWARLGERARLRPEGSYTTKLLEGGVDRIGKKVGEEATEVVIAAKNAVAGQGTAEIAEESADLLYHLMVLWRSVGLDPREVLDALSRRG